MSYYETEVVYITSGQLRMRAPSLLWLVYHRANRETYEFQTICGIVNRGGVDPTIVGMRRDTADLIARSCDRCWPPRG